MNFGVGDRYVSDSRHNRNHCKFTTMIQKFKLDPVKLHSDFRMFVGELVGTAPSTRSTFAEEQDIFMLCHRPYNYVCMYSDFKLFYICFCTVLYIFLILNLKPKLCKVIKEWFFMTLSFGQTHIYSMNCTSLRIPSERHSDQTHRYTPDLHPISVADHEAKRWVSSTAVHLH